MAALDRPKTASYEVHETVQADTRDNEDHTFCGIMFPVKAKSILPVEKIVIRSVSVRGDLGNLTVWVSNESICGAGVDKKHYNFGLCEQNWTNVYDKFHEPSMRQYVALDFSINPIVIQPGQIRAIYIHSTLPGDRAIVYDNTDNTGNPYGGTRHWAARRSNSSSDQQSNRNNARYEDNCIAIHTGKAHLSEEAFGTDPIWGWGNAWRDRREFVGQIQYGTVFKLWNPNQHISFGPSFKNSTLTLLGAQRRIESDFSKLPDECIYYILNMCRWDWFNDGAPAMKRQYRAHERRLRDAAIASILDKKKKKSNEKVVEQNMETDEGEKKPRCHQNKHTKSVESSDSSSNDINANDKIGDSDDDDVYIPDEDAVAACVETSHSDDNERNLMNEHGSDCNSSSSDNEDSVEMSEDSDSEEDSVSEDEEEDTWEAAHGYRADPNALNFVDVSSDSDNGNDTASMTQDEQQQEVTLMRRARFHLIPGFFARS